MSLIVRRERGLISVIGALLLQGSGFDNRNPLKQEAFPLTAHSTPATAGSFNRLRESRSEGLGISSKSGALEASLNEKFRNGTLWSKIGFMPRSKIRSRKFLRNGKFSSMQELGVYFDEDRLTCLLCGKA